jgi:hypothetical protein
MKLLRSPKRAKMAAGERGRSLVGFWKLLEGFESDLKFQKFELFWKMKFDRIIIEIKDGL